MRSAASDVGSIRYEHQNISSRFGSCSSPTISFPTYRWKHGALGSTFGITSELTDRRALTRETSKTPRHPSQAQTAVRCSDLVRHPKVHHSKISCPSLSANTDAPQRPALPGSEQWECTHKTRNTRKESASIRVHLRLKNPFINSPCAPRRTYQLTHSRRKKTSAANRASEHSVTWATEEAGGRWVQRLVRRPCATRWPKSQLRRDGPNETRRNDANIQYDRRSRRDP